MTVPVWLLWIITIEELGLWLAFLWHRQWIDAIYWTGVLFINAALLWRAHS